MRSQRGAKEGGPIAESGTKLRGKHLKTGSGGGTRIPDTRIKIPRNIPVFSES